MSVSVPDLVSEKVDAYVQKTASKWLAGEGSVGAKFIANLRKLPEDEQKKAEADVVVNAGVFAKNAVCTVTDDALGKKYSFAGELLHHDGSTAVWIVNVTAFCVPDAGMVGCSNKMTFEEKGAADVDPVEAAAVADVIANMKSSVQKWLSGDEFFAATFLRNFNEIPPAEREAIKIKLAENAETFVQRATRSEGVDYDGKKEIIFTGTMLEHKGATHEWVINSSAAYNVEYKMTMASHSHDFQELEDEESPLVQVSTAVMEAAERILSGQDSKLSELLAAWLKLVPEDKHEAAKDAIRSAALDFNDNAECESFGDSTMLTATLLEVAGKKAVEVTVSFTDPPFTINGTSISVLPAPVKL